MPTNPSTTNESHTHHSPLMVDVFVESCRAEHVARMKALSDAAYDKHIRPIVDEMLDELDHAETREDYAGGW